MSYIARFYCNDKIYSLDLSMLEHASIGSDGRDTLCISGCGLKKGHITINKSKDSYIIKAKGLYDRENSPISSDVISVGKTYVVEAEADVYISIHPKQSNNNKKIPLDNIQELYIGRSSGNNIILRNKRTSSNHCKIYRSSGLLKIRDLRSSNGTFVNGKKINEKTLAEGDIINISVYEIAVRNDALVFYNICDDMELNMEPAEKLKDSGTYSMFGAKDSGAGSTYEPKDSDTISMFDVNINVSNADEQYGIHIQQHVKNGTKSVFDID